MAKKYRKVARWAAWLGSTEDAFRLVAAIESVATQPGWVPYRHNSRLRVHAVDRHGGSETMVAATAEECRSLIEPGMTRLSVTALAEAGQSVDLDVDSHGAWVTVQGDNEHWVRTTLASLKEVAAERVPWWGRNHGIQMAVSMGVGLILAALLVWSVSRLWSGTIGEIGVLLLSLATVGILFGGTWATTEFWLKSLEVVEPNRRTSDRAGLLWVVAVVLVPVVITLLFGK